MNKGNNQIDGKVLKTWGNWSLSRSWSGVERLVFMFKNECRLHTLYADLITSESDVEFWIAFFKKRDFLTLDDISDLQEALNYLLSGREVQNNVPI
jgi:hypothetical protein